MLVDVCRCEDSLEPRRTRNSRFRHDVGAPGVPRQFMQAFAMGCSFAGMPQGRHGLPAGRQFCTSLLTAHPRHISGDTRNVLLRVEHGCESREATPPSEEEKRPSVPVLASLQFLTPIVGRSLVVYLSFICRLDQALVGGGEIAWRRIVRLSFYSRPFERLASRPQ